MYLIEEIVHIYLKKDEKRRKIIADNLRSDKEVNTSTNELVENGKPSEAVHGWDIDTDKLIQ